MCFDRFPDLENYELLGIHVIAQETARNTPLCFLNDSDDLTQKGGQCVALIGFGGEVVQAGNSHSGRRNTENGAF